MGVFDLFRRRATGGPGTMRARLEGAMSRRRLRGWQPPLENINSLVASGGPRLLARSRELVVTNGYAANACEAFAANLVVAHTATDGRHNELRWLWKWDQRAFALVGVEPAP